MRYLVVGLLMLGWALTAQAHFVFAYVEGKEARIVFGHSAAPDPKTPPTRAEKTTLVTRNSEGKETRLTVEKGEGNFYRAALPAEKCVVVYGTTEAGVTQRGDNPPMLSWYYPKVILGNPFEKQSTIGSMIPLEIVPVKEGDQVRFRILAAGKPLADGEVTVALSEGKEEEARTVKTDKEGWTSGFSLIGRYCVAARLVEEKPGEFEGKKYRAVRRTATLVFDWPGK